MSLLHDLVSEPTPDQVRDKMREVFERAEFQRSKNPLEKALDWIGRQLQKLGGGAGGGTAWGGSVATVLMWLVLIALAVGLVVLVVYVVRHRVVGRRRKERTDATVEVEEERSAREWSDAAAGFEAAGAWKDAIRCRYRELVSRLVDAGVAAPLPGRTTGELRADIADRAPAVSGDFSQATELFELPWYADADTGPAENDRFKALAGRVLEDVS